MLRLTVALTAAEPLLPVWTMFHFVAKMSFRRKDIYKPMSSRDKPWEGSTIA